MVSESSHSTEKRGNSKSGHPLETRRLDADVLQAPAFLRLRCPWVPYTGIKPPSVSTWAFSLLALHRHCSRLLTGSPRLPERLGNATDIHVPHKRGRKQNHWYRYHEADDESQFHGSPLYVDGTAPRRAGAILLSLALESFMTCMSPLMFMNQMSAAGKSTIGIPTASATMICHSIVFYSLV